MKHVGTTASFRQSVLVTGFGAFPGAPKNPTEAILVRLERHRGRLARLGIGLHCVRLPVVYDEIDAALADAVRRTRPDAILHLGLASRRLSLCVETRAANRAGALHPDASKRRPAAQVLVRGAPAALAATYPAARVLAAIRHGGLPARRSIDAGDYVCNATLYRSLLDQASPRIGFLHVPRTRRPTQPLSRTTRVRRPTVGALTEAVLAAVLVMAQGRPCRAPPRDGPGHASGAGSARPPG